MGAGPRKSNSPVTTVRPVDAATLICPDQGSVKGINRLLNDGIGRPGRLSFQDDVVALIVSGTVIATFNNERLAACLEAGYDYEASIESDGNEHSISYQRI